ncbi:MAG: dienelactone hydrolase family protein [Deltaproteobacteria bacterium]|nr:dienelactone hydrolase family protein [Deltaproteobacteria bacterium]
MPDITLTASDGHQLGAFRLDPEATPRGALVVLQEIFGVNDHIRAVAAMFTGLGYTTIAPALFDRTQRDVRLGYSPEDHEVGMRLARSTPPETKLLDIAAAIAAVSEVGKVGVIGYCLGGALAFRSAAKLEGVGAAVSYYGAQIQLFADERPQVPIQFHLARRDAYFPIAKARAICDPIERAEVHDYDADHGFACDHRAPVFEPHASALALQRTLRFLHEQLG